MTNWSTTKNMPKRAVRRDDLIVIKKELEHFLGDDILRDASTLTDLNINWSEVQRRHGRAHPVWRMWNAFLYDIDQSNSTKRLHLSWKSMYLISLLNTWNDIKDIKNVFRILNKLRHRNEFEAAIFEANIVGSYNAMGMNIVIPDDRGADFHITSKDGTVVYVEVKRIQDKSYTEEPYLEELKRAVQKIVTKAEISYHITVRLCCYLDAPLLKLIINNVAEIAKRYFIGTRSLQDGNVEMHYRYLGPWHRRQVIPFYWTDESLHGSRWCNAIMNEDGSSQYWGAGALDIYPYTEYAILPRIILQIRKAERKMSRRTPNILHVELPFKDRWQVLCILDTNYEKLLNYINKKALKISALVISASVKNNNMSSKSSAIDHLHTIVPNFYSYCSLPKDIKLLGAVNSVQNELEQFLV